MMPPRGAEARGEVAATIQRLAHAGLSDPQLGELIEQVAAGAGGEPDGDDAAIARVARRDHDHATRIPSELVVAIARETADAIPAWAQARETSDFALFRPHLERQVELRREVAACFPEVAHPYDALLDTFEPGATTAGVREVFGRLTDGLVPLVEAIAERPRPAPLHGPFTVDGQRVLALEIAKSFGYEDDAWRLDDAVHPFAQSLNRSDVRVTARWDEADLSGIFAVMHEVGHGLYEAGVDPALDRTTLGTGVSLGIHESQSRTWENQVGRSPAFWSHWYPRAQELFGAALGDTSLADFDRAINVVRPTFIRVEADEATYALHVILRFELEVALIEGTLAVADVPAAWNERMRDLLGIDVPDDAHGCLQDIHWSYGELGYFPTYALGNIVSAQLWAAARARHARARRFDRRRRLLAAARLAARERPPPRPPAGARRAAAPRDRAGARSRAAAGVPAREVRRAVRPLGVVLVLPSTGCSALVGHRQPHAEERAAARRVLDDN